MAHEWLTSRLNEAGYGLVSLHFVREPLSPGVSSAAGSSRLWQEQLLTPAFEIPAEITPAVHHRSGREPDALEFEYKTEEYQVATYHTMDRLAVVIRSREGALPATEAIARALFQNPERLKLVREQSEEGVTFGRQGREPHPPQPWMESLVWWSGDGEAGFAVEKAVALEEGKEPSTAGYSPQQILMWFDTFGLRRQAP